MTKLIGSTALATLLMLGAPGLALSQGVSPQAPGSASGGVQAQANQPPGATGQGGAANGQTMGGQAQGGQAMGGDTLAALSEDQLRSALEARGYSDIEGLERQDDNFRVAEAKRFGERVEDLRIDARTGQVQDEPRLTEDQARHLLRERGFSEVSDIEREGDIITASAEQDGNSVELRIDARTGMILQQQQG
ncbi:hypothetical protein ACFFMP_20455 [Pseudoroseomonas cervicalis]|uniref:PepSY domain-containing protein n=1 Tax=Pseudoroseomonas cervicalis ATCC 49957 TaxID=525371 RepID=D5RQ10_9PROT|nr:hypothetical protein [Pseudoroseomonas cervicalis]EFH10610.1 hypothetical protein HMPREF0731_3172 [Pseudoroseomonas cervicalis ATCC 49957]